MDELRARIAEFAGRASLELTPQERQVPDMLAGLVPPGTAIYVTHTPNATVADVAEVACAIEERGFRAFPHIVARRLPDERSLQGALARMRDAGIDRALLVAGDLTTPAGKFSGTQDVLATGALVNAGFLTLAVAGHPEGHKRIGAMTLWNALLEKQEYAEVTGTRMHIVSQFGFDPGAVCAWERQLTGHGVTLPVHVGIAGPAPLRVLIRYAMLCGIGTSLNALMANLSALASVRHLATSTGEVLVHLVRAREGALARRFVQPHVFSFGGTLETARWLQAVRNGDFELTADGGISLRLLAEAAGA
ncbi:MAG TPA: methylenetetrahydrofolate reductase [Steroidobacteraceae bacterium]|nr:methylenetetrahydrofolate reductase [Steroidobacteraceae bacterium]